MYQLLFLAAWVLYPFAKAYEWMANKAMIYACTVLFGGVMGRLARKDFLSDAPLLLFSLLLAVPVFWEASIPVYEWFVYHPATESPKVAGLRRPWLNEMVGRVVVCWIVALCFYCVLSAAASAISYSGFDLKRAMRNYYQELKDLQQD